jgi:outer membrane protein OmpA-like peptidoglycan-associated protein
MVRKKGFLTKRMEAFINIDGCILCFEGISNVTDVLTKSNEQGTFLANIEMDRIALNTTFELKNIYYDYDKSFIRPDAALELDKVVELLRQSSTL